MYKNSVQIRMTEFGIVWPNRTGEIIIDAYLRCLSDHFNWVMEFWAWQYGFEQTIHE